MWLRDDAAWRSTNVRTLLYGYDTSLVGSESFQDIDDIGRKLGDFITRIRTPRMGEINFEPRPIVFIGHSLGGLVIKEAICHLADTDWVNAQCVYGLVFFGVPNRGIRISHWLPMVQHQPNESLVRNLAVESIYVRNLHERFSRVFRFPTSRVVSVYETLKSKTAQEEEQGRWALTGKTEILVTRDSALDSCPPGLKHSHMSMNQNHADLPKFRSPHDSDYQLLIMYLNELWREAVYDVQMRFGPEGFFSRDGQTHDEHQSQQRHTPAIVPPALERGRSPGPHPMYFPAPYNALATNYASNQYAFNLNFLAVGQPYMPSPHRSLSPSVDSIQRPPYSDYKTLSPPPVGQPDAPPRYEKIASNAEKAVPIQMPAPVEPEVAKILPEVAEPVKEFAELTLEETENTSVLTSKFMPSSSSKALAGSKVHAEPDSKPEKLISLAHRNAAPRHQPTESQDQSRSSSDKTPQQSNSRPPTEFMSSRQEPPMNQPAKHQNTNGLRTGGQRDTPAHLGRTRTEYAIRPRLTPAEALPRRATSPGQGLEEMSDFAKRLTCLTCNVLFASRNKLFDHFDLFDRCTTSTQQKLVTHPSQAPEEMNDFAKRLTCMKCDTLFASKTQLVKHQREPGLCGDPQSHTKEPSTNSEQAPDEISEYTRRHTCLTCNVLFASRNQLFDHFDSFDRCTTPQYDTKAPPVAPPNLPAPPEKLSDYARHLTCSKCGMLFSTRTQLGNHIETSSCSIEFFSAEARDRTCPACGLIFRSTNRLASHLSTLGRCSSQHVTSSDPRTTCTQCGLQYPSRTQLFKHRRDAGHG